MGPGFSFGRALPDTLTATLTACGWENRLQITEKGSCDFQCHYPGQARLPVPALEFHTPSRICIVSVFRYGSPGTWSQMLTFLFQ